MANLRDQMASDHSLETRKMLDYIAMDDFKAGWDACERELQANMWKEEYENLCKFTTDYEEQRDHWRSLCARMADVLSRISYICDYHNEHNDYETIRDRCDTVLTDYEKVRDEGKK